MRGKQLCTWVYVTQSFTGSTQ